ncbi:MAG: hypothetical protein IPM45_18065 [Acidimicrobiales bacterium]|nr:hypothetical protein [Acidimicrobiales bacterium]
MSSIYDGDGSYDGDTVSGHGGDWSVDPGVYQIEWAAPILLGGVGQWTVTPEYVAASALHGWQVRVYDDDLSTLLAVVPRPAGFEWSMVLSDVGAGAVLLDPTDPWVEQNAALLDGEHVWQFWWKGQPRFSMLRADVVTDFVDEAGAKRILVQGPGVGQLLADAVVLPPGYPDHVTLSRGFTNARALSVFLDLLGEAQSRGCVPQVTPTFTAGADSDGTAWTDSASLEVEPGGDLYQWMRQFAEWANADWQVDERGRLHVRRSWGRDLTGTVVFHPGHAVRDARRTSTTREVRTVAYVADAAGQVTVSAATTSRRRRERWVSSSGELSDATRRLIGSAVLARQADEATSRTVTVQADAPRRVVFDDWTLGDTVAYEETPGTLVSARVSSISFRLDDAGATCEVTLGDLLELASERIARQIDTLLSPGPVLTTPPTDPIPPSEPVLVQPPDGLTVGTLSALGVSTATLSWSSVSGAEVYEAEVERLGADPVVLSRTSTSTGAQFEPLVPDTAHRARVRTVTRSGRRSDWSPWVAFTAAGDTGIPAVPAQLVVSAGLRSLVVSWQQVADVDVAWGAGQYEVQIDTTPAFTSARSRLVGGTVVAFSDLEPATVYWLRVRAVDSSGNPSPWTTSQQTATVTASSADLSVGSVVAETLAAGAVTADALAAGSVVAGKVAASAITAETIAANAIQLSKLSPASQVIGVTVDLGTNGRLRAGDYYGGSPGVVFSLDGIFAGTLSARTFELRRDGTAIFRGTVDASRFTSFGQSGNVINVNDVFTVDGSGNLVANNARITGDLTGGGQGSRSGVNPANPVRISGASMGDVAIGGANSRAQFGSISIGAWSAGEGGATDVDQIRWTSGASISNRNGGLTFNVNGSRVATLGAYSTDGVQFDASLKVGTLRADNVSILGYGTLVMAGQAQVGSLKVGSFNVEWRLVTIPGGGSVYALCKVG